MRPRVKLNLKFDNTKASSRDNQYESNYYLDEDEADDDGGDDDFSPDLESGYLCPARPLIDDFEDWLSVRADGNLIVTDNEDHQFYIHRDKVVGLSDKFGNFKRKKTANGYMYTLKLDDRTCIVKSVLYFACYGVLVPDKTYEETWEKESNFDFWDTTGALECGFVVDVLEFALRYKITALKTEAFRCLKIQLDKFHPDLRFLNGLLTLHKDFKLKSSMNVVPLITNTVVKHVVNRFYSLIQPSRNTIDEDITKQEELKLDESVVKTHPILAFQKTFGFFDGSLDTAVSSALNQAGLGCGLVIHKQCVNCYAPILKKSSPENKCKTCKSGGSLSLICVATEDEEIWKQVMERKIQKQRETVAREEKHKLAKEKRRQMLEKKGLSNIISDTNSDSDSDSDSDSSEIDEPEHGCPCGLPNEGFQISCDLENCMKKDIWWHLGCVGLTKQLAENEKWHCPICRQYMRDESSINIVGEQRFTIMDDPIFLGSQLRATVTELSAVLAMKHIV